MQPEIHTMVVGGTRGIGREVSERFFAAGHRVSVLARKASRCPRGPRLNFWPVDLADAAVLESTLTQAIDGNGHLTNLIFLQRFRGRGDVWQGELIVSMNATKLAIERLSEKFVAPGKDGTGSIVVMNSHASQLVADEQSVGYHAAKAALRQMVRYYACELAGNGIRVNCVTPGLVLKEEAKSFYKENAELHELYCRITPLRRMGTPADVANAIEFLCSPAASFITGQEIIVDGGLSLLWQASLGRQVAGLAS
jgi:NAD(P)-dependent dehydrogenase (short-subunit alcohol dehydrogenase family)